MAGGSLPGFRSCYIRSQSSTVCWVWLETQNLGGERKCGIGPVRCALSERKISGFGLDGCIARCYERYRMMRFGASRLAARLMLVPLLLAGLGFPDRSGAAGVTVITHGYNSDADTWVTAMADQIPEYQGFPGTSFTVYKIALTTDGSSYFYQWSRTNGSSPLLTDSGEIIVKLDWSQMAGGPFSTNDDVSTYDVAWVASYVLSQTNVISELGGHALAEFPIHLIGHSRGGSLMNEISYQLGTNGLWIDHLTTLDPHPLNNDGNFELFLPTDASASNTFANVLFRDNYWQDFPGGILDFNGEPAYGAYNRHLTNLSGGYGNTTLAAPDHSNVHLWYHGTIDRSTPATDTGAYITSSERQGWWVAYEQKGTNAGFDYSLIGEGNRVSAEQPLGSGSPAIRDGCNQWWDFGAGIANNRTALPSNNGSWPSLIKFNRTETGQVVQGQSVLVKLFYQWAQPSTSNATFSVYLDSDLNPLNSNQKLLSRISVPGSGISSVNYGTISVPLFATNASAGWHSLCAVISAGGKTRYLYAPELVQVLSNQQRPTLDIAQIASSQFRIGVNGLVSQTIVLQSSSDLLSWQPFATNTLASNRWVSTNTPPTGTAKRFYRATLAN
jgi:hypothetical protein